MKNTTMLGDLCQADCSELLDMAAHLRLSGKPLQAQFLTAVAGRYSIVSSAYFLCQMQERREVSEGCRFSAGDYVLSTTNIGDSFTCGHIYKVLRADGAWIVVEEDDNGKQAIANHCFFTMHEKAIK